MRHPTLSQIKRDKHYTIADAAAIIPRGRQTIYRWINNGRLVINDRLRKMGKPYVKGWSIISVMQDYDEF